MSDSRLDNLGLSIDFSLRKISLHHEAMRQEMLTYGKGLKHARDSGVWREHFPSFEHYLATSMVESGVATRANILYAKAALEMADGKAFTDDDLLELSVRAYFPAEVADKILADGDELND